MTSGQGTIYGARYYWVQPIGWMPGGDNISYSEMLEWNVEQFGKSKWDPDRTSPIPGQRWYSYGARFWFREAADLAYFKLRWS